MNGLARSLKDVSPRWARTGANVVTRGYGMATAGWRPMPDFLLVGTKRGGTTSLWNNLTAHPSILPMFPAVRGRKSTDFFFAGSDHTERWYRSHFHTGAYRTRVARRVGGHVATGEASPLYMWDPRIPPRIKALVPAVKVLVVLRDPVDRAYSHYLERVGQDEERLDFRDALAAEESRLAGEAEKMAADPRYHSVVRDWHSYRSRGIYAPQIRLLQELFAAEQLLILPSEGMYADEQSAFDRVCDFLGVRRHRFRTFQHHNKTAGRPMPRDVRDELVDFYRPHNEQLYTLVGEDYGWSR